jgi:hypothetical protein
MKWILFVMMFTTAPAPAPKTPPKKPVEKLWALQSTSTAQFETEDACVRAGDRITKSIEIASTLNLRGWCFCESLNPNTAKCPDEPADASIASDQFKAILAKKPEGGTFSVRSFAPPDK